MNEAEIIEYHHPGKLDAPSGTAIKTAELIKSVKAQRPEIWERCRKGIYWREWAYRS